MVAFSSVWHGIIGSRRAATERQRAAYRIVNLAVLGGLVLLAVLLQQAKAPVSGSGPVELWGHRVPDLCLNKRITGRPCPGCGLTRGLVTFFDGRVHAARATHPAAPWVGAWIVVQMAWRAALALLTRRLRPRPLTDASFSTAALLAACYLPLIGG